MRVYTDVAKSSIKTGIGVYSKSYKAYVPIGNTPKRAAVQPPEGRPTKGELVPDFL